MKLKPCSCKYSGQHSELSFSAAMFFLLFLTSVVDKIVTSDLSDGKRSRNIKIRAQLKILTERDID